MKKIDSLTEEQGDMMPIWADKWIKIGLSTEEANWEVFEQSIKDCYDIINTPFPKKVIRVKSPLVGAFAASITEFILNNLKKQNNSAVNNAVSNAISNAISNAVNNAASSAVSSAVRDAVSSAVSSAVSNAISNAVSSAVDNAIDSAVSSAVRGAVGGVISSAVSSAVRDAVSSAVDSAVGDAVNNAVGDAVGSVVRSAINNAAGSAVKLKWHNWVDGQFWVGGWWGSPSFVSFFTDVCNLELDVSIKRNTITYQNLCSNGSYVWFNSDFVIACDRPKSINITNNRLHNENGKAIEFRDGWGLYSLNGVIFDEELYYKVIDINWPFEERLKIEDVDQRTQAINPKFCNIDNFIKYANGRLLDEVTKKDNFNNETNWKLYTFPAGDIFTEDAYYCYFNCPSTNKKHFEGVEKSTTVAEAMAWAMSTDFHTVKPEEWESMIPLVHEN